jgi:hypothetical protein
MWVGAATVSTCSRQALLLIIRLDLRAPLTRALIQAPGWREVWSARNRLPGQHKGARSPAPSWTFLALPQVR